MALTLRQIVSTALINKLRTNQTITTAVYHTIAPGSAKAPYILILYARGGWDNLSPRSAFDIYFDIVVVSNNQATSEQQAALISETLKDQDVIYEGNYASVSPVREIMPITDYKEIQGAQWFATGAQYRFRGAI